MSAATPLMMLADATADAAVLAVLGSLALAVVVIVGANIVLLIQDRRHDSSRPRDDE